MKLTIIYDYYYRELTDDLLQNIKEAASGIEVATIQQKGITAEDLFDSDIVFGRIPPHLLIDLPNLKWLHLASAGANGMTDINLYANKDIILTKSSGTFGKPIAEHIIGMMIALSRNFGYYYEKQQNNQWCESWPDLTDVCGSNVLVVGLGDIGTEVCKRLSGFECDITGFRRDVSKPNEAVKNIKHFSQLREYLPGADFVILCTPGTTETDKLIGKEELALMKKSAIIINVGRGMVIDTDALAKALKEHIIGGAGLDVTEPEPLPPEHPLWTAPNLLITPHVSAATKVTTNRRVMVFIDLLKCYLSNKELYNKVDFTAGY